MVERDVEAICVGGSIPSNDIDSGEAPLNDTALDVLGCLTSSIGLAVRTPASHAGEHRFESDMEYEVSKVWCNG